MTKIKDLPKCEWPREKMEKTCAVCGKKVQVILYKNRTYRGGEYFGKKEKGEYWECLECCWQN